MLDAGRAQGSKQAELEGVEENQIRRAGQWNQDTLPNCYLTHPPRKFLRSMAGSSLTQWELLSSSSKNSASRFSRASSLAMD